MNLVEALNSDYTPLAGRDMDALIDNIAWMISTHTPLAGRDRKILLFIMQPRPYLDKRRK